jgi:adenylate cyclase
VRVGTTVLPTDANGELWLHLSRSDPSRYISAHTILDGSYDPKSIAGRHILIGSSAVGLLDLRATPLDTAVPGVEIHAQALEQMLSGDHLSRPSYATGAELTFLVVLGAVVAWMIYRIGAVGAAAIGGLAILTVFALSWLAYANAGLLFDPVYPALAILLLYLATSLNSYIETESDRNRVRSAFGHYVAAPLVEELARHHEKLRLGGETREVSVLFADVRGFTKISEGLDAEELIRFLNRLFTPLSDVILAERGTIDKFMGDAVMAFWNAPLLDADHARNACTAALKMLSELDKLNALWAAEAASRGEVPQPVRIGIGLNTGACCVGNVGSPQRFDYSILGDVVNVASRLEEATKTYGIPIVAGERTAAAAPDLAFLEIDAAMMRGKERPERIFALLGDETVAVSERYRTLKAVHAELLAALRAGDMEKARAKLKACRALGWVELNGLLETYAHHLAHGV